MKIVFVFSFYSALRDNLKTGIWNPKGMPAVYKLFEYLWNNNIDFGCFFVSRDDKNDRNRIDKIKINETEIYIIHIKKRIKILKIPLVKNIYNIYEAITIARKLNQYNTNLFYVDRANVLIAAILKIFYKKHVVLRLHGIATLVENMGTRLGKIANIEKVLSFNTKYDLVVCSEDGSPTEYFMKKYLNKNARTITLLNGVDKYQSSKVNRNQIKQDEKWEKYPTILFVGRLTKDKSPDLILNVLIKLYMDKIRYEAIFIGDGPLLKTLREQVKKYNLKNIKLIGAIPHKNIQEYFQKADIYISINKLGNLSNTVLEAINYNQCIITLGYDEKTGRDLKTEEILKDKAILLKTDFIEQELYNELKILLVNNLNINIYKNKIKEVSVKHLYNWDYRILQEYNYLREFIID